MKRLDQLIPPWAEKIPEREAVNGDGETLTYGALHDLANRFARAYLLAGVKPGDRIGLFAPKSPRVIAAAIGALRVGGIYVPLDPHGPAARAALIAENCQVRLLVTTNRLGTGWPGPLNEMILLDGDLPADHGGNLRTWPQVLELPAASVPDPGTGLSDPAFILYTSGSTGVPKGVVISHRNALAFADWTAATTGLESSDRVANHAPLHFDLSVFDFYASFLKGASVSIVDHGVGQSPRGMMDLIRDREITVWYSVPSALVLMLERGELESRGAPGLRVVIFAGEVFPVKYLRRLMAAVPRARYFNFFGPTETNVCTAYEVTSPPASDRDQIPIGTAACGDRIEIIADGKPVTNGQVGELYVDGPTVMLGYWRDEGFCPAPRPYPTGDLVSRSPGGILMYHGRKDHMVKIHGFRIEIGEVEAVLHGHPHIEVAVVTAVDQKLVATIVSGSSELSVLDVKRHCAENLPQYMVPGGVMFVPSLPRTSNGKPDRVAIRAALLEETTKKTAETCNAG